jgi:hypothetical protein
MAQILQLRAQVKERSGNKFNLQQFHDVLLASGPFPISTLASTVFGVRLKPLSEIPSPLVLKKLYAS